MLIRVDLGGWEHGCCGPAYEIGDVVTLEIFLPVAGEPAGGGDYLESHHGLLGGGATISGRVAGAEVDGAGGTFVAITRMPSGASRNGFDSDEPGDFVELATGVPLENLPSEYVVILEVDDDSSLPTEPAILIG